jgi:hypothetical protein
MFSLRREGALRDDGCFIGYRFEKRQFRKRGFSKPSLAPFPVYWKPWNHGEGQLGLRKQDTDIGFEVLRVASMKMAALMMEVANTSETLVNLYQTTRRYNPEDSNLPGTHVRGAVAGL